MHVQVYTHTFVQIVMTPEYIPMAKNCPSLVQLQLHTLEGTLRLATDFDSGDHRPTCTRSVGHTDRIESCTYY